MKISLEPYGVQAKRSGVAAGSSFVKPIHMLQPHGAVGEASDSTEVPVWKRALDLTCLFLALPAVLLATVVIAVIIKMVSPGPVFFKQERVGHRRRRFVCWKFRTMKVGADAGVHQQHLKELLQSDAPMTTLDATGDERLIPCGAM